MFNRLVRAIALSMVIAGGSVVVLDTQTVSALGARPMSGSPSQRIRNQSGRIGKVLGRARQQGGTNSHVQRYLRGGYQTTIAQMVGDLIETQRSTTATPRERLRDVAAVARTILAAETASPGTHTPEMIDQVHRLLAQARVAARVNSHETAVELEMGMNNLVLDALTTEDGTVAAILRPGKPAPNWLAAAGGSNARWDQLSRTQKIELLRSQSHGDMRNGREIAGVRFRRRLSRPQNIRKGSGRVGVESSTIVTDGVLLPYVEHMGPASVATVGGVEAHVRQMGAASANLNDAMTISSALGHERPGVHQHITTHLGPELLAGDNIERIGLVDFYRRANLVAEMRLAMTGLALSANESETNGVTWSNFDYLDADNLSVLNNYLGAMARTRDGSRTIEHHGQLKMAAVGFRPAQLYRREGDSASSELLIGFEARSLDATEAGGTHAQFVDALQQGLIGRHYGVSRARYAQWRERFVNVKVGAMAPASEGAALTTLHYNRHIDAVLRTLPRGLRVDARMRAALTSAARRNNTVKMLIHDWSRDPVLMDDPEQLDRVVRMQQRAIIELTMGETSSVVVQNFIRRSGLYERFAASIGMNTQ